MLFRVIGFLLTLIVCAFSGMEFYEAMLSCILVVLLIGDGE